MKLAAERLKEIEYAAGRYSAIKMGLLEPTRCEKCDWCKATKVLKGLRFYEVLQVSCARIGLSLHTSNPMP